MFFFKDSTVTRTQQRGFINGGIIAMLIGGVAIGGLLMYGLITGQELPLWPAVVVVVVNLVAAAKVFLDLKKAKKLRQTGQSAPTGTPGTPR